MSKEIRFINSKYDDLFRIPDGATIQIEFSNEPVIKTCKYIDDYHTKIGSELFSYLSVCRDDGACRSKVLSGR